MLKVLLLIIMPFLSAIWSMGEEDDDPSSAWEKIVKLIPETEEIFQQYPIDSIEDKLSENKKEKFIKLIDSFKRQMLICEEIRCDIIIPIYFSSSQMCNASGDCFKDIAKKIVSRPDKNKAVEHFVSSLSGFFGELLKELDQI